MDDVELGEVGGGVADAAEALDDLGEELGVLLLCGGACGLEGAEVGLEGVEGGDCVLGVGGWGVLVGDCVCVFCGWWGAHAVGSCGGRRGRGGGGG